METISFSTVLGPYIWESQIDIVSTPNRVYKDVNS